MYFHVLTRDSRISKSDVPLFCAEERTRCLHPARSAIRSETGEGSHESPQAVRGIPGSEFEPRCPLQKEKTHRKGVSFLFGAFPFLLKAKRGRCGGLIKIAQGKPAKVFPAHTLFLANSRGLWARGSGKFFQKFSGLLFRPGQAVTAGEFAEKAAVLIALPQK